MPDVEPNLELGEEFRALYAEHVRYVWKSLRRLGVAERDCEDLAQEVFVAVYRHIGERDPARPMRAWLYGFTFRVAVGHLRRAGTKSEIPTDPEATVVRPDEARDIEKAMGERDAYVIVHAALAELPIEQRAVVAMHDLDEIAAPEIAAVLDVPLNTVYSRLRVGRERFRAAVAARVKGGSQ